MVKLKVVLTFTVVSFGQIQSRKNVTFTVVSFSHLYSVIFIWSSLLASLNTSTKVFLAATIKTSGLKKFLPKLDLFQRPLLWLCSSPKYHFISFIKLTWEKSLNCTHQLHGPSLWRLRQAEPLYEEVVQNKRKRDTDHWKKIY